MTTPKTNAKRLPKLDDKSKMLVEQAIIASQYAYCPYSNYHVGAALSTTSGRVYTGCNVENAAYPATICAERTALVKAISEGERQFDAIAVVTRNGGAPCGTCRQMLYEFSPELTVIIADMDGHIHHTMSLQELLPHGFSPKALE